MVSWDCKIDVMTSSLLFPLYSLYCLLGLQNPHDEKFSSLSVIFTLWSAGTAYFSHYGLLGLQIRVMTSSLLFPLFALYALLGLQNPRDEMFSSLSFIFTLWSVGTAKSTLRKIFFSVLYFHSVVCWDCKMHVMTSSFLFPLFSLYFLLGLQNPSDDKFSSRSFIFTLWSAGTAKCT